MGRVWEGKIRNARAKLEIHGASLTDESLQTVLLEVEAIVNFCLLTKETINDVASVTSHFNIIITLCDTCHTL